MYFNVKLTHELEWQCKTFMFELVYESERQRGGRMCKSSAIDIKGHGEAVQLNGDAGKAICC